MKEHHIKPHGVPGRKRMGAKIKKCIVMVCLLLTAVLIEQGNREEEMSGG